MPNTAPPSRSPCRPSRLRSRAGELDHRLHPRLLQHDADGQAGDVHHGRLVVGDVVRVAVALQRVDLALDGFDVGADRRRNLDADRELAGASTLARLLPAPVRPVCTMACGAFSATGRC